MRQEVASIVDSQILMTHDLDIDKALLGMGFTMQMINLMWQNENPRNVFEAVEMIVAHQECVESSEDEESYDPEYDSHIEKENYRSLRRKNPFVSVLSIKNDP
jgi:hypothetical protein